MSVLDVDFGAALADRHEAAGALAEAPDDEHPEPEEDHSRQHPGQNVGQPSARNFARIGDVVLIERGREVGSDPGRDELLQPILLRLFERSLDRVLLDPDLVDLVLIEQRLELAIGYRRVLLALPGRSSAPA